MKKQTILAFCIVGILASSLAQVNVKSIDNYIEKSRRQWEVPGMAVAIVKDGEVVLSRGYGIKELGKADKVDGDTQFAIASNTKAFVASCLAQLVEEGELSWDDKVKQYLPYFSMYDDPYVSSETTIKDLLCHRIGLGTFSGDVLWYKSEREPKDFIKQANYVPQVFGFRNGYGYSNLMFITAGEVIREVSGKPWEDFVKERFLTPLEMNQTTLRLAMVSENVATPHKPTLDKGTVPIKWVSWDKVSAAGGIISSTNDMAKWMMMNLNRGEWKGKRYLAMEQQNLLWTPHNNFKISEDDKESLPGRHFGGYGLGWGLMDYHGNLVVSHGGGYDGMYSRVVMVPDIELGVVILTNTMQGISYPLAMHIVNQYLQKDTRDWSKEFLERARSRNGHKEDVEERRKARKLNTSTSIASKDLVGTYYDPMYGEIYISEDTGSLRLQFESAPRLAATLEHWHYDTYEIKWDEEHAWFDFGTISFEVDNNLKVEGFEFDVPNADIFFHELHPVKRP